MIDVNRDPSGASLYPGQATTGLCPTETFDGEPLYRDGAAPDDAEISRRRETWFAPYHAALAAEVERLRETHPHIVALRLPFDPLRRAAPVRRRAAAHEHRHQLRCERALQRFSSASSHICAASPFSFVANGRFKGGWITRRYGNPAGGVHAVQMELACRGYMHDPPTVSEANWPAPYDASYAAPMEQALRAIFDACVDFARSV